MASSSSASAGATANAEAIGVQEESDSEIPRLPDKGEHGKAVDKKGIQKAERQRDRDVRSVLA